jgi:hypothetical protein
MGWKDILKEYNPKEMDAKRAKIQRNNAYLRREERRKEEENRQREWERKHGESGNREETWAMSEFVAGRRDSPNFKDTKVSPPKRRKKPKKGRLPPKPQRGRKKEQNSKGDVNSENLERMAGAVTTTAPAHAKLFKPAYRTRKKRKDE